MSGVTLAGRPAILHLVTPALSGPVALDLVEGQGRSLRGAPPRSVLDALPA